MLRFFKTRDPLKELEQQRKQTLKQPLPDVFRHNLMANLPAKETSARELSFLVVDFETTGLDEKNSDIISIGWIEIQKMQIDFSSKNHIYVSDNKRINHETAVINHIVPQMLTLGKSLDDAIETLLYHAKDKVLVAHGKVMEQNFLNHYAQQNLGISELPLIWIDTLKIEEWRSTELGNQYNQDNRLISARKRYNLPQYATHNALIDSIATAELLLAQIAHIYRSRQPEFGHLFSICQ